jgi:hypothetical protein
MPSRIWYDDVYVEAWDVSCQPSRFVRIIIDLIIFVNIQQEFLGDFWPPPWNMSQGPEWCRVRRAFPQYVSL